MKKYCAEFVGTMMLVFLGCGAAILHGLPNIHEGSGYLGIAVAFGLALIGMAYSIGNISGCHINPAVSLAMCLRSRMEVKECIYYIVAQFLGGFVGALLLYAILGDHEVLGVANGGFGCNGYGELSNANISMYGAFFTELILTFAFVLVILGVTSKPEYAPVAGLIIGLTLIVIHIVGIPLTGTSVNPARSLAPAILKGGMAMQQVPLFIIAPLLGGMLAALASGFLTEEAAASDSDDEE